MTSLPDFPREWRMKDIARRYLATVPHKAGETIQLGWFVFRIRDDAVPPEIESLDFRSMASFTTDFAAAEYVRNQQWETLCYHGVAEEPCTLRQTALVSRSYTPGHADAFIERQTAAKDADSGWYVGVLNESRDMNDAGSFQHQSLYELSITDDRMTPFWLLPVGAIVALATAAVSFAPSRQRNG